METHRQIPMNNIIRRTFAAIAICGSSLIFAPAESEAQTRFSVPDTAIDVSKYKTVEECMALRNRLWQREKRKLPYWEDTLKINNTVKRNAYPDPVKDTLVLCVNKFSLENVDYDNYSEYLDWITVFFDALRDSDAKAVIEKKLSTTKWDKEDTAGRHNVIISIINAIQMGKGLRWETLLKLSNMMDSAGDQTPWRSRMIVYNTVFVLAGEFDDSVVQRSAAEKIIALEKTLTDDDKITRYWTLAGRQHALEALEFMNSREMIDSLRVSGKAFVAFRSSHWEAVRGANTDKLPNYVGEIAKPVTADFWFKREKDTVVKLAQSPEGRSTLGRISMVVFYDIKCADKTPTFIGQYHRSYPGGYCLSSYPILKRTIEQYPSLDVTIVSITDGYIADTEPMTPEEEATQKSLWWLSTHKLPVTLAVSDQKFFRLPEPDGRRIDEPHQNSLNYLFDSPRNRVGASSAFLLDEDGTVIWSGSLSRFTEPVFIKLLEVVTKRNK